MLMSVLVYDATKFTLSTFFPKQMTYSTTIQVFVLHCCTIKDDCFTLCKHMCFSKSMQPICVLPLSVHLVSMTVGLLPPAKWWIIPKYFATSRQMHSFCMLAPFLLFFLSDLTLFRLCEEDRERKSHKPHTARFTAKQIKQQREETLAQMRSPIMFAPVVLAVLCYKLSTAPLLQVMLQSANNDKPFCASANSQRDVSIQDRGQWGRQVHSVTHSARPTDKRLFSVSIYSVYSFRPLLADPLKPVPLTHNLAA